MRVLLPVRQQQQKKHTINQSQPSPTSHHHHNHQQQQQQKQGVGPTSTSSCSNAVLISETVESVSTKNGSNASRSTSHHSNSVTPVLRNSSSACPCASGASPLDSSIDNPPRTKSRGVAGDKLLEENNYLTIRTSTTPTKDSNIGSVSSADKPRTTTSHKDYSKSISSASAGIRNSEGSTSTSSPVTSAKSRVLCKASSTLSTGEKREHLKESKTRKRKSPAHLNQTKSTESSFDRKQNNISHPGKAASISKKNKHLPGPITPPPGQSRFACGKQKSQTTATNHHQSNLPTSASAQESRRKNSQKYAAQESSTSSTSATSISSDTANSSSRVHHPTAAFTKKKSSNASNTKMGRIYNSQDSSSPNHHVHWTDSSTNYNPRYHSNDPAYENSPDDPILNCSLNNNNNENELLIHQHYEQEMDSHEQENEDPLIPESGATSATTGIVSSSSTITSVSSSSAAKRSAQTLSNHPQQRIPSSFEMELKNRGLEMVEQEGDGNCLFRAVSLQVYGDPDVHMDVRKRCLDFMAKDEAHFAQFIIDEPFQDYIQRKRLNGVHGNNPEIQAISELFNRPVEVFVPEHGGTPINIFHAEYKTCDTPIRLSYHDGNHYNAVVDPLCPTAGLGLGLPGLEPGLADRLQVQKAVAESDDLHVKKAAEDSHKMEVQRAIQESKQSMDFMFKQKALALSDLEATDFELEQAALASSLESYQDTQSRKQPWNHYRERRRHSSTSSSSQHSMDRSSIGRNDTNTSTHTHATIVDTSTESYASMRPIEPSDESYSSHAASTTVAAVAGTATSAASATARYDNDGIPSHLLTNSGPQDEYPQIVQELVMNGFELSKVLKAHDLIGNNFDDLLAFLMSSGT